MEEAEWSPSGEWKPTASTSSSPSHTEDPKKADLQSPQPHHNLLQLHPTEKEDEEDSEVTEEGKSRQVKVAAARQSKFLFFYSYFTLRGFFRLLGRAVGHSPFAFAAIALLLSCNSFGMLNIILKDRIRDGYTPINAPSRYETDVIREFWNSTGDPMMTILIMLAKDGGSMHRKPQLDEAQRIFTYLNDNFSVPFEDEQLVFARMCDPYCGVNTVFEMFKEGFDAEFERAVSNRPPSSNTQLNYPVASIRGFEIHLERSLFGVKLHNGSLLPSQRSIEQNITNMDYVKVLLTIFRGDKGTQRLERQMSTWEIAAYDYALNDYNSDLVELQIVGTDILDREMMRDGRRMTPFFAAGFGFMITFVSICVFMSAIFYDEVDRGKILIAVGATLVPILAITSTYGLISLIGCRVNSFMLVMPFLIMGIGVDDSFLMTHSWQRMSRHNYPVIDRLGLVYEEVGPSITITSLTNFLSFGIGALTPTPEIRLFCFATALAMIIDFLYELILFGPVLAIASRFEKNDKKREERGGWRLLVENFSSRVLRVYCRLIGHRIFTFVILTATVAYWYFAIIGLMNIKTRLDTVKILPRDSPLQKPNFILSNIVWAEYHPVTVLISQPFNVSNKHQMERFWELVHDFESLHNCKGPESSLIWLRDYIDYFYNGEPYDLLSMLLGISSLKEKPVRIDPITANITYDKLWTFLRSPFYKHWNGFLHARNTSHGSILDQFWMSIAYNETGSWEIRIQLMQDFREIAARYQDLNASVWEPNGMFVDQMLSLKSVAIHTVVLTLLCMAVVCAIFIPNPCSVITASIAIASISLGVVGFLSWWRFDLDPVVMAAVLMSIGMSVDFTAHVSYHYQLTSRKEICEGRMVKKPISGAQEKLEHTLEAVGWPMVQAGFSTIICILPLLFLQAYSPSVFVATIFLVVCWGLLHGLLLLPAILGALPDCLTNANCYRTFLSTSSEKSCRYAGADKDNEDEAQEMREGLS